MLVSNLRACMLSNADVLRTKVLFSLVAIFWRSGQKMAEKIPKCVCRKNFNSRLINLNWSAWSCFPCGTHKPSFGRLQIYFSFFRGHCDFLLKEALQRISRSNSPTRYIHYYSACQHWKLQTIASLLHHLCERQTRQSQNPHTVWHGSRDR